MTIGTRLRHEREQLGLSQEDFGRKCNVGRTTITAWEKDKSAPDATVLEKLAKAGIDVAFIVTGKKSEPSEAHSVNEDAAVYKIEAKRKTSLPGPNESLVENYAEQIGVRLEDERKRLGLTQEMVSVLCDVSREMWGKYERGLSVMGTDVLYNFSLSGADVLYILTGLRNEQAAKTTQEISLLRAFRFLTPEQKTNLTRLIISFAGQDYFKG